MCAALALMGLVLAGCGSSTRPARRVPPAPTGAPRRPSRPRPSGSSTRTSTRTHGLEAAARDRCALPELAEARDAVPQGGERGDGRRPTLAQLRTWLGSEVAIGVLDVPPTAPIRRCSASPRCATAHSSRPPSRRTRTAARSASTATTTSSATAARPSSRSRPTRRWSRTRGRRRGRDRPPGRQRAIARGLSRLQGHAGEPAERQHRRRLRAGLGAAEARDLAAEGPEASADSVSQAQCDQITSPLAGVRSFGFSLGATEKGLRMRGTTLLNSDAKSLPAVRATLLSRVPGNSWLAASFGDVGANARARSTRRSRRIRPPRSRSRRPRPRSASSSTTSTRCSRASTRSSPGRARRSRRG